MSTSSMQMFAQPALGEFSLNRDFVQNMQSMHRGPKSTGATVKF